MRSWWQNGAMSLCFQTRMHPSHPETPQALIWTCHEQPAASAMQCFTNNRGWGMSLLLHRCYGHHTSNLLVMNVFIVHGVCVCVCMHMLRVLHGCAVVLSKNVFFFFLFFHSSFFNCAHKADLLLL